MQKNVIVIPMRNPVVVAKQLATLDALSDGRVVAGIGIGWHEGEFANVGAADRFHVRGAFLEETINLWRHLWSGSHEPFHGRFHDITDFAFEPLPVQQPLPIIVGGRDERALRRAGRLADGYHSSAIGPDGYAQRLAVVAAAAEESGRPVPWLSARVLDELQPTTTGYAMRSTPEDIAAEVRKFAALGVRHLALYFGTTDAREIVALAERIDREIPPLL